VIAAFPSAIPLQGLIGGVMIGLSAAILLLGIGRIAGVSGLFARATGASDSGAPRMIALAFTVGLPIGAFVAASVILTPMRMTASWPLIIVGGLLVGFGTRLGSGCTSGHGVCGMSRHSPRSLAATATFMAAGIATVTAMRLIGFGS